MDKIAGIQIDLKYHMPNKRRLPGLLDTLKSYGVNTILLEYEDAFPFERYRFLRAADAFTPEELRDFLAKARGIGMRVMPLAQSLAHLEFALDHKELAALREAPDIPTQICPSNPAAVQFVLDLMDEMMAYHREDEFFHCGGDEAWALGYCPTCAPRLKSVGTRGMWLEHQRKIASFVAGRGKRPVFWDDIFWEDPASIKDANLPRGTTLMCWNYNITSLAGGAGDGKDIEFGGGGNALRQVEAYHAAGYDTIGCPCCNYGQIFPRHTISLENTRVWALKARRAGMLGVVNSSWSSFHIPWQTQTALFRRHGGARARSSGVP